MTPKQTEQIEDDPVIIAMDDCNEGCGPCLSSPPVINESCTENTDQNEVFDDEDDDDVEKGNVTKEGGYFFPTKENTELYIVNVNGTKVFYCQTLEDAQFHAIDILQKFLDIGVMNFLGCSLSLNTRIEKRSPYLFALVSKNSFIIQYDYVEHTVQIEPISEGIKIKTE